MTANFTIRSVNCDDAEELRLYATRLFAEGLPGIFVREAPTLEQELEFIRAHTEKPGSALLVAVSDGEIVGLIGMQPRPMAQERHVGVFGISVASGHRGHGIGSALIAALVERAPGLGISRIECEAMSRNPRAVALYERLGFVREGVRRDAITIDGEVADMIGLALLLDRARV